MRNRNRRQVQPKHITPFLQNQCSDESVRKNGITSIVFLQKVVGVDLHFKAVTTIKQNVVVPINCHKMHILHIFALFFRFLQCIFSLGNINFSKPCLNIFVNIIETRSLTILTINWRSGWWSGRMTQLQLFNAEGVISWSPPADSIVSCRHRQSLLCKESGNVLMPARWLFPGLGLCFPATPSFS